MGFVLQHAPDYAMYLSQLSIRRTGLKRDSRDGLCYLKVIGLKD